MELYDIKNNPLKVQCEITDRANELNNDLYILKDGNRFEFDLDTQKALRSLQIQIGCILDTTY